MVDENAIKALAVKISDYDCDVAFYKQRWYVHLLFVLLAVIFGLLGFGTTLCFGAMLIAVFLFIIRVNKRQKLSNQKLRLSEELNLLIGQISLDTFFELKQKIIQTGR